jgi:hypothetical protein
MRKFLGLEHFKSGDVAILTAIDGSPFRIDVRSLKQLIENLKRLKLDVSEEQKALKALEGK